jgi:hypothetical protein
MPTLTRSVGFSAKSHGLVLPINRLPSTAIISGKSGNKLFSQRLKLRPSPIGGLEIYWHNLEELEEQDTRRASTSIVTRTLNFHNTNPAKGTEPYYTFRINDPELWVYRPMSNDAELWIPLMLEALISGIGMHRKNLVEEVNEICIKATGKKFVNAYKLFDFRIDPLYSELMRQDKDRLIQISERLLKEPHKILGLTTNHVKALNAEDLNKFLRCRPFWATDFDKLEELLQISPAEIFGFCRGISKSWISEQNACCAAENLGYVMPSLVSEAPQQLPSITEIKPSVASNVKDKAIESLATV